MTSETEEGYAPARVAQALEAPTSSGASMNETEQTSMETAFGEDFSDVRIHTGPQAESLSADLGAHAFTYGSDIYFNSGKYKPDTSEGRRLLAHELTHVVQQGGAIQAQRTPAPVIQRDPKKDRGDRIPYTVRVYREMTREEFQAEAAKQIFGGPVKDAKWELRLDQYTPAGSPYTVLVSVDLLRGARGQANRDRGIGTDSSGVVVVGENERAKAFQSAPASDEKTALLNEIDARYYKAVGDPTHTKIKPGQKGAAALWLMIRNEVLFQLDHIRNLPPAVTELIKTGVRGRELTPEDYDQLFAVAKKIERMPVGQSADFASKVTGKTTNLGVFEASLDHYIAQAAARDAQTKERDNIQTKLLGLEEVYKKYRSYKLLRDSPSDKTGIVRAHLGAELDAELQQYHFAGLADFEAYIKKFEQAFEQGAQSIVGDVLAKFGGKLFKDSERLNNPVEVHDLYQKLAAYRSDFVDLQANAPIANQYEAARRRFEDERTFPDRTGVKLSRAGLRDSQRKRRMSAFS